MLDPALWLAGVDDAPHLLVIGGASLDVLHVQGAPVATPGGSGLYTALAAARAGVRVTMLAPRPDPMPDALAPALDHLEWVGPIVPPERLPRFEIAYDSSGAPTRYDAFMGAEGEMTPDLLGMLDEVPRWVFCVPFAEPQRQRLWVDTLSTLGCVVVSTTYIHAAIDHPDLVRSTAEQCSVFVCNQDEADALWPGCASPATGAIRYLTLGPGGAMAMQGDHHTRIPGVPVTVVDTTGAGDTFTGTAAAHLIRGMHPVEAGRRAVAASAAEVTGVGPARLLAPEPLPDPPVDDRVTVDPAQVFAIARLLGGLDDFSGSDFAGETWPPTHHPVALDTLFASTLQQWGFWTVRSGRWDRPMIAPLGGVERKGSDYLSAAFTRWLHDEPGGLGPAAMAALTRRAFDSRLADDGGTNPLPESDTYHGLATAYGRTMTGLVWTAESMVAAAESTDHPLSALLRLLDHVGGYREDPLRKKSALLGVILRQRPEAWLREAAGDDAPPIVDYHIQRTCLRTGMVTIADHSLRRAVTDRLLLPSADEEAIRRACYLAVAALAEESGRDMGTVDWFLFQMRRHCPEATTPICSACPADSACSHHTALFQPVFRTTAY
ncbi:hypothetical protein HQ535_08180 [bacterium]|nr:hypothetical protein [bacterium]